MPDNSPSRERLREALEGVMRAYVPGSLALVSFPEEMYFVERSLIELGVLQGSRNRTAHRAFVRLLDELEVRVPGRLVGSRNLLSRGTRYITLQPFPWQASDDLYEAADNGADLPRWRLIYRYLEQHLQD